MSLIGFLLRALRNVAIVAAITLIPATLAPDTTADAVIGTGKLAGEAIRKLGTWLRSKTPLGPTSVASADPTRVVVDNPGFTQRQREQIRDINQKVMDEGVDVWAEKLTEALKALPTPPTSEEIETAVKNTSSVYLKAIQEQILKIAEFADKVAGLTDNLATEDAIRRIVESLKPEVDPSLPKDEQVAILEERLKDARRLVTEMQSRVSAAETSLEAALAAQTRAEMLQRESANMFADVNGKLTALGDQNRRLQARFDNLTQTFQEDRRQARLEGIDQGRQEGVTSQQPIIEPLRTEVSRLRTILATADDSLEKAKRELVIAVEKQLSTDWDAWTTDNRLDVAETLCGDKWEAVSKKENPEKKFSGMKRVDYIRFLQICAGPQTPAPSTTARNSILGQVRPGAAATKEQCQDDPVNKVWINDSVGCAIRITPQR